MSVQLKEPVRSVGEKMELNNLKKGWNLIICLCHITQLLLKKRKDSSDKYLSNNKHLSHKNECLIVNKIGMFRTSEFR